MNFKERFKGKISSINRQGNIEVTEGMAIPTRCTAGVIKKNCPPIIQKAKVHEPSQINQFPDLISTNPYPNIEEIMENPVKYKENTNLIRNVIKEPPESTPEDTKDYQVVKVEKKNPLFVKTKYYKLGGLGPNIGDDIWNAKKEKQARMTEYGKMALKVHKYRSIPNTIKERPLEKAVPDYIKEAKLKQARMLEYSKNIPKPKKPQYIPIEKEEDEVKEEERELERLEQQHREYMNQINELKNDFI